MAPNLLLKLLSEKFRHFKKMFLVHICEINVTTVNQSFKHSYFIKTFWHMNGASNSQMTIKSQLPLFCFLFLICFLTENMHKKEFSVRRAFYRSLHLLTPSLIAPSTFTVPAQKFLSLHHFPLFLNSLIWSLCFH